jgi:hypothetical protein
MPKTKKLLVDLSTLACSVIIVGVGKSGEFANMYELSSDKLRDDTGRVTSRHIV